MVSDLESCVSNALVAGLSETTGAVGAVHPGTVLTALFAAVVLAATVNSLNDLLRRLGEAAQELIYVIRELLRQLLISVRLALVLLVVVVLPLADLLGG